MEYRESIIEIDFAGHRRIVMNITKLILSGAALIALAVPAAFAQSTTTTTADPDHATINQRKENQQDRIANGVKSGELNPRETANLESKEAGLNTEEHNMRADENGKLTAADRAKLTRQQNQLSKQIYAKKHNARKS
jgi:predicted transglutaminase-like cysteine proteinase